jgi:hypothetical protein
MLTEQTMITLIRAAASARGKIESLGKSGSHSDIYRTRFDYCRKYKIAFFVESQIIS